MVGCGMGCKKNWVVGSDVRRLEVVIFSGCGGWGVLSNDGRVGQTLHCFPLEVKVF